MLIGHVTSNTLAALKKEHFSHFKMSFIGQPEVSEITLDDCEIRARSLFSYFDSATKLDATLENNLRLFLASELKTFRLFVMLGYFKPALLSKNLSYS